MIGQLFGGMLWCLIPLAIVAAVGVPFYWWMDHTIG